MTNGEMNTEFLDRAIIFAVRSHEGTRRRGKNFPYIIKIIGEVEADQIVCVGDASDRNGLIDDPRNRPPVERGGNNTGRFAGGPLRLDLCLAENNTAGAVGNRLLHRFRLITADENAVFAAVAFEG